MSDPTPKDMSFARYVCGVIYWNASTEEAESLIAEKFAAEIRSAVEAERERIAKILDAEAPLWGQSGAAISFCASKVRGFPAQVGETPKLPSSESDR